MQDKPHNAQAQFISSSFWLASIFAIGIVLLGFLAKSLYHQTYRSEEARATDKSLNFYRTDKSVHFYQLMKDLHELFEKEDLFYSIYFGTLLGASRHQGFIPWDDDLDIIMMKKDEPKILALKSKLRDLGYQLRPVVFGYKIYKGWSIDLFGKTHTFFNFTHADIFLMHTNENKVHFHHPVARSRWPKDFVYTEELYPLQLYTFGSFQVWGPNFQIPYLERSYGLDWDTIAYKIYHFGENVKPIKTPLTPDDRLPAYPFGPLEDKVSQLK